MREVRLDEAELIGAARSGDREAFDELVRRTFVDTFTLARRLTGNEEDARDVVQESYLRAWKAMGKFRGEAGDNVGVLLRGTKREEIERGQVLCKPGSITPHTEFVAEAYILTKEEGGRHTPFFTNYRPQFYFRTTDVTGTIKLPEGVEMVMPGDNISMDVELITPVAMDKGMNFAIREGGRTVGAGVVVEIVK